MNKDNNDISNPKKTIANKPEGIENAEGRSATRREAVRGVG